MTNEYSADSVGASVSVLQVGSAIAARVAPEARAIGSAIRVCFPGYALWKTPGKFCRQAEPDEISQIAPLDVVLPT